MSDQLYVDHILDHYESPYHKGTLANSTCSHTARNPLCGDMVTVQLRVDENNRITDAYFDGTGCAISQAAASILCEDIEGKTLDEVREFQAQDMLDLLRVRLTPTRQRCGLLGFTVVKTLAYAAGDAMHAEAAEST